MANSLKERGQLILNAREHPIVIGYRRCRGSDAVGFAKCCLEYLWVCYLMHNRYIFGVADEKSRKSEC